MASIKKIKLTDGFAEFDPSSLMPLQFEELVSLTPPNTHFFFPSEADIQQQYTLRNIRKYTCAFLIGLGLLGNVGKACATPDKTNEAERVATYASRTPLPSAPIAEPPPPSYNAIRQKIVVKPDEILMLRRVEGGKIRLHQRRKGFRYHPNRVISPKRLGTYIMQENDENDKSTLFERARTLAFGGLLKDHVKYSNPKASGALSTAFLYVNNAHDRLSDAIIVAIQNVVKNDRKAAENLKKFLQKKGFLNTRIYQLAVQNLVR